jgi:hypothetical protein
LSNWLQRARDAVAMVSEGRQALSSVVSAVRDGTAALSTTDQAELDRLLAKETAESRAAHDELEQAIQDAEKRQG